MTERVQRMKFDEFSQAIVGFYLTIGSDQPSKIVSTAPVLGRKLTTSLQLENGRWFNLGLPQNSKVLKGIRAGVRFKVTDDFGHEIMRLGSGLVAK